MSTTSERTKRVQIRISEQMFDRLSAVASDMGMPTSTVASVAISEYVIRKEREHMMAAQSTDLLSNYFDEMKDSFDKHLEE